MNTIPLIFNERKINLTRLGGKESVKGAMDVSVVMLCSDDSMEETEALSPSREHRVYALEQLQKCPFASIVCVETDAKSFNMEDISRRFPSVKFIMPLESVTTGDMINVAMAEVASRYVLVLRDTIKVGQNVMQPHFFERLTSGNPYCVAPRLIDSKQEAIPTQFVPEAEHGHFSVAVSSLIRDGMSTLYPFDFIGLYNREKFMHLGGFDYTIASPYYQNLDLAMRSWLWGEKTVLSTSLLLSYSDDRPIDDTTTDTTYLHFYLKNILPRYRDGGVIATSSFLRFLTHSSLPLFEAFRMFRDARDWVKVNSARFNTDLQHLIEEWGTEEEV